MKTTNLDFTQQEVRKEFIEKNESGVYGGKNNEGRQTIVLLDQGKGMTVKNINGKGWFECINYDKDGFREDNWLEPGYKEKLE